MNKELTSVQELAATLLDQLEQGTAISLEITTEDASIHGLLRLIMELHEKALARRMGVTIHRDGERTIRLTVAS